jgi:hypothetical protein
VESILTAMDRRKVTFKLYPRAGASNSRQWRELE